MVMVRDDLREMYTPTHASLQFSRNNLEHIESRVTSFGTGVCGRFSTHAFDSLIVCCDSATPKNDYSAEEWNERLRAFANSEFQFRKVQMQAKGNHWGN